MGRVHNMTGGGGGIKLSFIAVTTPPTKTAYYVGDTFDPAGMVVKATYTNGAVGTVGGYSCSPSGALTLNDTTITITYTEGGVTKTTTQAITVTKQTVAVPTPSSLTYNGNAQAPTWTGYDSTKMSKTETAQTNAGTYSTTFALLDTAKYEWADHTTGNKTVSWSIAQADPTLNISPTTLSFSTGTTTGTINASGSFDGAVNASSDNTAVATVSVNGTVITVASTGASGTATISVSVAAGTNYKASGTKTCAVTAQFAQTFGVMWNFGASSTALTRLTSSNDPNGYVDTNITTNPSPAVGTGSGSSPFDTIAPWKDMEEYNIISNAVSYKKGDANFSRTANDTVVYIPEFYYKVVNDASGSKRYFYIANGPKTGFTKHPGSGRYVGKYNTGASYVSKSGIAPLANITRATARTNSANKGANWWQYDYATYCAIWLLYLVEFADWNSQAKIGKGYEGSSVSFVQSTGKCDTMTYHTGRAAGTDGATQVMYRWIEGLWGNQRQWVDGANFSDRAAYICTDNSKFADDTSANYTAAGVTLPSSGYIKQLGYSSTFDWAFLPSTNGGSETTYISDYVYSGTGWRPLYVGGYYFETAGNGGLFSFGAGNASSASYAGLGARLLFIP